jgi:hypothetical protein
MINIKQLAETCQNEKKNEVIISYPLIKSKQMLKVCLVKLILFQLRSDFRKSRYYRPIILFTNTFLDALHAVCGNLEKLLKITLLVLPSVITLLFKI